MGWSDSGEARRSWTSARATCADGAWRAAASCLRGAADTLLATMWGATCAACRGPLATPTRGAVCETCWREVRPLGPTVCRRCGMPHAAGDSSGSPRLCGCCASAPSAGGTISMGRAFARYEGSLRRIVHAFKYRGHRSLAAPLGRGMRLAGDDVLRDAHLVVAVPLHPLKQLSRGFNPAEDLAKHLGLPYVPALRRHRATRPQAGLDAVARRANVRGAFSPSRRLRARTAVDHGRPAGTHVSAALGQASRLLERWSVAGRVVVLVDDVLTTGATLDACARVLRAAGAREVRALTAAAVVRE